MEDELNDLSNLSPSEDLNRFESFIVASAKEVAERKVKTWPDWFTQSEEYSYTTLIFVIKPTSNTESQPLTSSSKTQSMSSKPAKSKERSKMQMAFFFMDKCQSTHFKDDPKVAWEVVFQIIKGFNAHCINYNPKTFMIEGRTSKNTKESARTLKTHFHEVLNRES